MLWGCVIAVVIGWLWDERDATWWRYVLPSVGVMIGGSIVGIADGYATRRPLRKT